MSMPATVLLLSLGFAGCGQEPTPKTRPAPLAGYDVAAPIRSFTLPHKLREISAIVAVDARTVASVQDEAGSLFFVDVQDGSVQKRVKFGPPGDYEGLARVGDDYWVLRSDGHLMHLGPKGDGLGIVREFDVDAPQREFEGLCFDAKNGVLVVAPKAVSVAVGGKDDRPLYAVDPATGRTAEAPYAVIDRDRVADCMRKQGLEPGREGDGKRVHLRLHYAEVAVQPTTGELWLLSAVDRALVVAKRDGEVVGVHVFAPEELPQPEAATFLPDGDLVIASEGLGGAAVLRVYGRAGHNESPK